ncbi:endonuclease/exonuclease/phosphatase family protein [Spirosoma montaniterrae]|uniref:Ig-like domain-containing protein n=1 Tax=Spirosoma montaniterrae TaxID=1178516 RepID=A0A1P9WVI4_9BACT|nr:endonuclease/exonuclease/phosphatase family protein [Spirosoma montaniterrae]AQG79373.1 hypothetical protein AWR27_08605 [Spirosoma montaniterrae]
MGKLLPKAISLWAWSLLLLWASGAWAQSVSLTGATYSESFNTLATSGTANTSLPTGWTLVETGTNANGQYRVGTGSNNAGDTYSFGLDGNNERAFGGLRSGSLVPLIGASFTNNTGGIITSITINYTGEQWRLGTASRGAADRLDFQYSLNATSLSAGTYTDVDALDFITPNLAGTVGARDGNDAANRTAVSNTITGLSIQPGATFWIRFTDFDVTNSDDGLSVDDFSLTTNGTTPEPVATITATPNPVNLNYVAGSGPASQTVTVNASNLSTASGNVTVTSSNTAVTLSTDGNTFVGSVTLPYSNSTLTNATLTARLVAGLTAGPYSATLTFAGGGASTTIAVAGTVSNPPATTVRIREIQGNGHISPVAGQSVTGVTGIVTVRRNNGFWMQDPNPDSDDNTSEGIFVFTSSAPTVVVGDGVLVSGTVQEFRANSNNLSLTQLTSPVITVTSSGNTLPAPTVISSQAGTGVRVIPTNSISNDYPASGDVELSTFDPAEDGLDFFETLEGMRVQINSPVTSGFRSTFGELFVIADGGAGATGFNSRKTITISGTNTTNITAAISNSDFNPERIQIDDVLYGTGNTPNVNPGSTLSTIIGVVNYDFQSYEVLPSVAPTVVTPSTNQKEITALTPTTNQVTIASFNVENLGGNEDQAKFDGLAAAIVTNLRSPDIIGLEEIQDNNGATNDGTVAADVTLSRLIQAIAAQNGGTGPVYEFRQINPVNGQDGGEPGGNIRVGFLFNPARVQFVDRPGGGSTTNTTVSNVGGLPRISASPGRILDPNPAETDSYPGDDFTSTRKPLVGEFTFNGQPIYVIVNHFSSRGGSGPLTGRFQPPAQGDQERREEQGKVVNAFVDQLLAVNPNTNVVVLGDFNEFQFFPALQYLTGNVNAETPVLTNLIETLPVAERYTYIFDGNAQALDYILASNAMNSKLDAFDAVHINAEFLDQLSDHDPSVARFTIPPSLSATLAASATGVCVGSPVNFSITVGGLANAETYSYTISNGTNNTSATGISATAVQTSLTPTVAGSYTLTVLSSPSASASAVSGNVALNTTPTASLTASSLTFCAGNTLTLTAGGGTSYTFSSGASQIGGSSGNTATVSQSGTYSVIVANASGCTATASLSVSVTPATSITAQPASASTVCVGGVVSVSVGAAGQNLSYQWYKNSQILSGQTNAVLSLSNVQTGDNGSYYVVVTGSCGSPQTSNLFTLTVNPRPAAPALSGVSRQVNSSATPISLTQFVVATGNALSFSGVNGLLNPPTANISTSGFQNFSVTQTDGNSCVSAATPFSLTVLQSTTATQPGDQTVCRGTTVVLSVSAVGTNLRYQWFRNGTTAAFRLIDINGVQRGTQTASLTLVNAQTTGNYYCQITGTTGTVIVGPIRATVNTNCSGRLPAPEAGTGLLIDVAPNPLIDGQLRAVIRGVAGQRLRIQATNLSGQVLRQQQWEQADAEHTIDWNWQARPAGTYLLQVATDEQMKTIKLIKP